MADASIQELNRKVISEQIEKARQRDIGLRWKEGVSDQQHFCDGMLPQGPPVDRQNVLGIFHPAASEAASDAAERLARDFKRNVVVMKEEGARWVYLFFEEHVMWPEGDDPNTPAPDWYFSTDWVSHVTPEGEWKLLGCS